MTVHIHIDIKECLKAPNDNQGGHNETYMSIKPQS